MTPRESTMPADSFLGMIKDLSPEARVALIHSLDDESLNLTPEMDWGLRIYHLVRSLPPEDQYPAFQLLTEGQPQPGLFAVYGYKEPFEFFLKTIPSDQRVNALMVRNSANECLVHECMSSDSLMAIIFDVLDENQRLDMFSMRNNTSEIMFFSLMKHPDAIRRLVELHTPKDILWLCTRFHSGHFPHAVINAAVLQEWHEAEVKRSIEIILFSLDYTHRLSLLKQPDMLGCAMTSLTFLNPQDQREYDLIIDELTSKKAECVRIIGRYNRIYECNKFSKLTIASQHDLSYAIDMVALSNELDSLNGLLGDAGAVYEDFLSVINEISYDKCNGLNDNTISIFDMPSMFANYLYFELVSVIHEPKDLFELVQVMFGAGAKQLKLCLINVPETFPEGLSYRQKISFFRHSRPIIEFTHDLSMLRQYPPTIDAISSLILHDNVIIPLSSICQYSFRRHVELYEALHRLKPGLASVVYHHNHHWTLLEEAILMVSQKGTTPRQAILHLIRGLREGGVSVSGRDDEAQAPALSAVSQFMSYYGELSESLKRELDDLKLLSGVSLFVNLPSLLEQGQCVEWLSHCFEELLRCNASATCLDQPTGISQGVLSQIEKMCRVGLSANKNQMTVMSSLPAGIARSIVGYMNITLNNLDFLDLLSYPDQLLPYVIEQLTFDDSLAVSRFIQALDNALKQGFFTEERAQFILACLIIHPELNLWKEEISTLTAHYQKVMLGDRDAFLCFIERATSVGLYHTLTLMNGNPDGVFFATGLWFALFLNADTKDRIYPVLSHLSDEHLLALLKQQAAGFTAMELVVGWGVDLFQYVLERLGQAVATEVIFELAQVSDSFYETVCYVLRELNYSELVNGLNALRFPRVCF